MTIILSDSKWEENDVKEKRKIKKKLFGSEDICVKRLLIIG